MKLQSSDIRQFSYYRIPVGMIVSEYMLDQHNENRITLPDKRKGPITGVTIATVPVMFKDDDAKEYIIKTLNGEMGGFVPHYYDCIRSTWKILDDSSCWKRKNGTNNSSTICIAITVNDGVGTPGMFNFTPFQDAAKLSAYILYKNKLTPKNIKVTSDCAEFVTSRWKEFKLMVIDKFKKLGGKI